MEDSPSELGRVRGGGSIGAVPFRRVLGAPAPTLYRGSWRRGRTRGTEISSSSVAPRSIGWKAAGGRQLSAAASRESSAPLPDDPDRVPHERVDAAEVRVGP